MKPQVTLRSNLLSYMHMPLGIDESFHIDPVQFIELWKKNYYSFDHYVNCTADILKMSPSHFVLDANILRALNSSFADFKDYKELILTHLEYYFCWDRFIYKDGKQYFSVFVKYNDSIYIALYEEFGNNEQKFLEKFCVYTKN
jgi:hypothetical protein